MKRLVFALWFVPIAAFAQSPKAYECKILHKGPDGWMGDVVLLSFADDHVGVYDWVIHEVHEAPILAKLTKKTERRYRFRWSVKGVKPSNDSETTLSYTANVDRKTLQISLNGNLHGFDNVIYGKGKCEPLKN